MYRAFSQGRAPEVILLVLEANVEAAAARDVEGRLPIQCVPSPRPVTCVRQRLCRYLCWLLCRHLMLVAVLL